MSLSFSSIILHDYVYQQDLDGTYVFDPKTNDLQLRNKNDYIKIILTVLRQIYTNIITYNNVDTGVPLCNIILLDQALEKYSRDIYGTRRLKARIDNCNQLTSNYKENLMRFQDYGLKIESDSPYMHREVAVMFYWLCVLKPFSLEPPRASMRRLGLAGKFHNEYISFLLIQSALETYNIRLTIPSNMDIFCDFLYDLHYRNLSRSSLEFLIPPYLNFIEQKKSNNIPK